MRNMLFRVLHGLWPVCATFFWVFWLASIPAFIGRAATNTLPPAGANNLPLQQVALESAAAWGASLANWAWINTAVNGFTFLVYTLVALLIWTRIRTGFGLLTAYILLSGGSSFMDTAIYGAELSTVAIQLWELGGIVWPLFFVWLYLFPNGKPEPRGMLWVLAPLATLFAVFFSLYLFASLFLEATHPLMLRLSGLQPLYGVLTLALVFFIFIAQIYRYFHLFGTVEQKQIKWFLFGLATVFLPTLLLEFLPGVPVEADALAFAALPIGIGVAILRYRLWDIELIIRRTLQYTLLTGLLTLFYYVGVVTLQWALEPLTGDLNSSVITVVTTLGIAALFNPLRRLVQTFIDRRFYRQKYDAAQVLTKFAQTARDEVEMEVLQAALLQAVQETLQPEQVGIWLLPQKEEVGYSAVNPIQPTVGNTSP